MEKRTYSFAVGIVLLIATIGFFVMPYFMNLDAFIPFIFALVSFLLGISFFFRGLSEK